MSLKSTGVSPNVMIQLRALAVKLQRKMSSAPAEPRRPASSPTSTHTSPEVAPSSSNPSPTSDLSNAALASLRPRSHRTRRIRSITSRICQSIDPADVGGENN